MLGGIVVTEEKEERKSNLNKDKPQINRGVELLLRKRRKNTDLSKVFQVKFSFFNREITLSLDIRKK